MDFVAGYILSPEEEEEREEKEEAELDDGGDPSPTVPDDPDTDAAERDATVAAADSVVLLMYFTRFRLFLYFASVSFLMAPGTMFGRPDGRVDDGGGP
mmetsp:Transcript_56579/g.137398  ORF Transcript_56579/g.137398 Transcript_56579/m.137398 type:complete len:98 (+) Transcript_56579:4688-4981(+)